MRTGSTIESRGVVIDRSWSDGLGKGRRERASYKKYNEMTGKGGEQIVRHRTVRCIQHENREIVREEPTVGI